MTTTRTKSIAERLETAWRTRTPIPPLGEAGELRTVEEAYAAQRAWAQRRVADGERVIGRKIGLTSPGMQRQMGVGEPDFGDLWGSRHFTAGPDGVAEVPREIFVAPRVEGELAFLMGRELVGPGVTEDDVLAAATAAAPALEIVDSRIADWRIALVDTIADNASYGAFTTGAWSEELLHRDLAAVPLEVLHGGRVIVSERGSAVLGSPLTAVAWLANKLGSFGVPIREGDIVLSGSFGPAAPAEAGDEFAAVVPGCEPVRVRFVAG